MTNYNMNKTEYDLMKRLERMKDHDPELAQALGSAGILDAFPCTHQDSCPMADVAGAKSQPSDQDFPEAPMDDYVAPVGQLITQTLDNWGLYPQEELFRLIWKMRDKDAELTFMRGNAARGRPLAIWRAETRYTQGQCVLYCYDEDRRNYLYMILCGEGCGLTRSEFFHEMQDFLKFPEKHVWMCDLTAKTALEVI